MVDRLVEEGYRVTVLDSLAHSVVEPEEYWKGLGEVSFIKCDLRRPRGECLRSFRGAFAVFHFAADPEVRAAYRRPGQQFENNLVATWRVLEASRRAGVEVFVFASSSTVYGDPRELPTPESHPLEPISVYGATKAGGEQLVRTYSLLYGMRGASLRYANIVGPRLRHGVIWDFIAKLRRDPRRLEVLGDGTQRKSYLYVGDAVDATMAVYNKLVQEEAGNYAVYNVGNNDWITVNEIADIVAKVLGLEKVEYVYKPWGREGRGWPGDVKLMLLDIRKITGETGWRPTLTSREAVDLAARHMALEAAGQRGPGPSWR
ncbi:MAG: NAD-dependent epimerase/dehydratase family protein [Desulfurococcales archaeon]|nr:NAD-dependent epimerase/dehydratase family protein [Desulfurococcales archaeon]